MGKEKTYEIFNNLKNKGYEIKYYIPRIYDSPIIGKLDDIKKITIDVILNKLDNDTIPDAFQVVLEHTKNWFENVHLKDIQIHQKYSFLFLFHQLLYYLQFEEMHQ